LPTNGLPAAGSITGRFAGLSPAAQKVLGMAKIALPAVPRNEPAFGGANAASSDDNFITNPITRDAFIQSLTTVHYLFAETAPEIHVPGLESLKDAGVDFMKLSQVFEAYEEAGPAPEFILAPVNLSLAGWKKLYSNLSVWQDINDPRSPNKLQRSNGGGLWVLEYIENHYNEIIRKDLCSLSGGEPRPSVSAIITKGGETGAISDDGLPTGDIVWQAAVIPSVENGKGETGVETPIGLYLTFQAERFYLKKSPIGWTGLLRYGDEC
jgi:hypothetical protein